MISTANNNQDNHCFFCGPLKRLIATISARMKTYIHNSDDVYAFLKKRGYLRRRSMLIIFVEQPFVSFRQEHKDRLMVRYIVPKALHLIDLTKRFTSIYREDRGKQWFPKLLFVFHLEQTFPKSHADGGDDIVMSVGKPVLVKLALGFVNMLDFFIVASAALKAIYALVPIISVLVVHPVRHGIAQRDFEGMKRPVEHLTQASVPAIKLQCLDIVIVRVLTVQVKPARRKCHFERVNVILVIGKGAGELLHNVKTALKHLQIA